MPLPGLAARFTGPGCRDAPGWPPDAPQTSRLLVQHVIRPWFPRSIDRHNGGFLCDFDGRWQHSGPDDRLLEFQARQARAAATLLQRFPSRPELREAVDAGMGALRDLLWDREQGGWWMRTDRAGRVLDGRRKHAHGTAYAIGAGVAIYEATAQGDALELALCGFDWLDRHGYDPEHGGYWGWLEADGSRARASDHLDQLGVPAALKGINVQVDLLAAFRALARHDRSGRAAERLAGLYALIGRIVTPTGALPALFYPDWRPAPALEQFGYTMQMACELVPVARLLGEDAGAAAALHRLTVDHVLARGWDPAAGGITAAGQAERSRPIVDYRGRPLRTGPFSWWVQVESLRALLPLASVGPEYAARGQRLWRILCDRYIDWRRGGFREHPRLRGLERLRPGTRARFGHAWKDASHETRFLLEALAAAKGGTDVRRGV
jgi:mannobiose 2-epimerase